MTRLANLSDGVFAIALTLLALDIRLPEGVPIGDLPGKVLELAPKIMVYLISFVVIGGAWGAISEFSTRSNAGMDCWSGLIPPACSLSPYYRRARRSSANIQMLYSEHLFCPGCSVDPAHHPVVVAACRPEWPDQPHVRSTRGCEHWPASQPQLSTA
jgi:hypothetical protein